jgi:hypothetical protein
MGTELERLDVRVPRAFTGTDFNRPRLNAAEERFGLVFSQNFVGHRIALSH